MYLVIEVIYCLNEMPLFSLNVLNCNEHCNEQNMLM